MSQNAENWSNNYRCYFLDQIHNFTHRTNRFINNFFPSPLVILVIRCWIDKRGNNESKCCILIYILWWKTERFTENPNSCVHHLVGSLAFFRRIKKCLTHRVSACLLFLCVHSSFLPSSICCQHLSDLSLKSPKHRTTSVSTEALTDRNHPVYPHKESYILRKNSLSHDLFRVMAFGYKAQTLPYHCSFSEKEMTNIKKVHFLTVWLRSILALFFLSSYRKEAVTQVT